MSDDHPIADDADSKDRLRFWLRAYAAVSAMEKEIGARLRERFGASVARFDIMAHLFVARDGLTMGALTRRLLVTGGNTTGLATRLVREDLAVRQVDPDDRRIARVALTPGGRALFLDMAKEHEAWVNELTAGLPAQEMTQAAALMEQLRRRLAALPDQERRATSG